MKYMLRGTHNRTENGKTVKPKEVVSLSHLSQEDIDFLTRRGIYREINENKEVKIKKI